SDHIQSRLWEGLAPPSAFTPAPPPIHVRSPQAPPPEDIQSLKTPLFFHLPATPSAFGSSTAPSYVQATVVTATMAGRGDIARPRPQARGRQQHQTPSLHFDIVLEIAASSDPATLVRMATTCREVRRRVADDPTFRGRLRLQRTDRFILPLLRGHLVGKYNFNTWKEDLWLVDTTAADATRLITVGAGFGSKNLTGLKPVSSREGLLLIRATNTQSNRKELRVCDPATRGSQILPREPKGFRHSSEAHYVLLVGDGENGGAGGIGRPFQVLKARVEMSEHYRSSRCLQIQNSHRSMRVTLTTLPTRFPRDKDGHISYLLATDSVCGSPIVLVADEEKISMWVQSKHTKRWKEQPQVVIMNEEIPRFNNVGDLLERPPTTLHVQLAWFSERSGVVLFHIPFWCFFWLDLLSKNIIRKKYKEMN
ncbi:hypothetical protein EJB05_10692, partial [Eragrostis curvula]